MLNFKMSVTFYEIGRVPFTLTNEDVMYLESFNNQPLFNQLPNKEKERQIVAYPFDIQVKSQSYNIDDWYNRMCY